MLDMPWIYIQRSTYEPLGRCGRESIRIHEVRYIFFFIEQLVLEWRYLDQDFYQDGTE